jgi:hypothetical protein
VNNREKVPKQCRSWDFGVQNFEGPEDEIPGTRQQKSRSSERGSELSFCRRMRIAESSVSEIQAPGLTEVSA